MKFLMKMSDKVRKHFEKGGKFEKIGPLFDAGDTFMFSPPTVTKKGAHVRDAVDLKRVMMTVIYAVLPCFFFGVWNAGHQYNLVTVGAEAGFMPDVIRGLIIVLPIVFVSYAVGGFWEVLFSCVRKHEVNEGLLVTGLLFPLILPPTIPLWQVAVGISFGVVIGKEIFGGTGMNIVNPALMSRAFLFFAYAQQMVGNVWTATGEAVDSVSGATPPGLLLDMPKVGNVWTATGEAVDSVSGATPLGLLLDMPKDGNAVAVIGEAGFTLKQMVVGNMPGSIGETSVIACLIGAAILLLTGIGSWRIMLSCVLGLLGTAALANVFGESPVSQIPPYYHLVMGGFAFGAIFMATDPVSAAATSIGKWIYGAMIGVLIIIVRLINPAFPEGVMLSILFMNIVAPLIDHYVVETHIRRRSRRG